VSCPKRLSQGSPQSSGTHISSSQREKVVWESNLHPGGNPLLVDWWQGQCWSTIFIIQRASQGLGFFWCTPFPSMLSSSHPTYPQPLVTLPTKFLSPNFISDASQNNLGHLFVIYFSGLAAKLLLFYWNKPAGYFGRTSAETAYLVISSQYWKEWERKEKSL
jgi:hypothetical protein